MSATYPYRIRRKWACGRYTSIAAFKYLTSAVDYLEMLTPDILADYQLCYDRRVIIIEAGAELPSFQEISCTMYSTGFREMVVTRKQKETGDA